MTISTSMKPLDLYVHIGPGPNPHKVAFLLEALSLPYTIHGMQFGDNSENGVKSEKFLKVNPNGRVPALVDGNEQDFVVWESGAIMYYLCEKYDMEGKFFGKTIQEKTETMIWLTFQLSGLGPSQGQVNWFRHYHEPSHGEAPGESVKKRYENECYRLYSVLEKQLEGNGGEWICNGRLTIADFAFHSWLRIAHFAALTLDAYPKLKAYAEKMEHLPVVQEAMKKMPMK